MRNLIHLTTTKSSLDGDDQTISFDVTSVAATDGDFIVLTNVGSLTYMQAGDDGYPYNDDGGDDNSTLTKKWNINLNSGEKEDDSWFKCSFVDEINAAICLSRRGKIAKIDLDDVETEFDAQVEIVGEFEYGINCAAWSPDYEVLLLHVSMGGDGSCLLSMNNFLEVMSEITFSEKFSSEVVTMSWKGDASAVSVSIVDGADSVRRVRIYSRENLELQALGRMETGADVRNVYEGSCASDATDNLAWNPNGSIIAAVQEMGRGTQVIFFEACGLRHREFKLRDVDTQLDKVTQLQWNSKSDILAVAIERTVQCEGKDEVAKSTRVQLWHRDNYHWYLKYELRFPCQILKIDFDIEKPYDLLIIKKPKDDMVLSWSSYEFCWDHNISCDDLATATVIDGELLNLSPLALAVVPPPMCASSLKFDAPVIHVTRINDSSSPISLVAHLSNGDILFLGGTADGLDIATPSLIPRFTPPRLVARCNVANDNSESDIGIDLSTIRQVTALYFDADRDVIVLICVASGLRHFEGNDKIVELEAKLNRKEDATAEINVVETMHIDQSVLRVKQWSDNRKLLIELVDGQFMEYTASSGLIPSDLEPMLEPCPWIEVLDVKDITHVSDNTLESGKPIVVGMSRRSRLYFGEHLISNGASSFLMSKSHQFLCYVTLGSRSQLRFIAVSFMIEWDPLAGSDENQNIALIQEGYEPRSVERGSRLVAVTPSAPTAVLQMSRGNLEGVVPRALALPFARSLIDKSEYGNAFDIMRRQRIDLNLIFDHNPQMFLDQCSLFLEQVERTDYLNLFIASLQDYDVTSLKYIVPNFGSSNMEGRTAKSKFDFTCKVNEVCTRLRHQMMNEEACNDNLSTGGRFHLPILSTFAKENPPKLEQALDLINDIAQKDGKSLFSEQAQSSIQYLAFLADYDLIFNTALGMYDFDLAKAVARNSQKDPKVYLPMLSRLSRMSNLLGRHDVDMQLGRYESALIHLAKAKDEVENHFERCLELTTKHKLHSTALQLFTEEEKRCSIMVSLGNRHMEENRAEAALATYLAAKPKYLDGAKEAARICGDWRTFFACCADDQDVDIQEVASYVSEEIAGGRGGNYSRREEIIFSSRILIDYCRDIDGAIDALYPAAMWTEARRLAKLYSREEMNSNIIYSAKSYGQTCVTDFEDRATAFEEANERYTAVLSIQKEFKLQGQSGNVAENDNQSLFSVASNMSNASLYSNASASSVGSVSSLSSVISVGVASTFSFIGEQHDHKHKSKFNKIGGGKKKKKNNQRKKKNKMKRGSEEELKQLVGTLKGQVVDDFYFESVIETIKFLAQEGELLLARNIFDSYNGLQQRVDESQSQRREKEHAERDAKMDAAKKGGEEYVPISLDCEDEVNSLLCKKLPDALSTFFSFPT